MIYFDSAYVAKFYPNEPGHELVRACAISAGDVATCELALAEVTAVFHRKLREGFLTLAEAAIFFAEFDRDVHKVSGICSPSSRSCSNKSPARTGHYPHRSFSVPPMPCI